MNARRWYLAALVLAVLVLTANTFRRRQMQRRLQEQIYAVDRFVDAHVRLHVVAKDPAGLETDPKRLTVLRHHDFGGWIDTKSSPPRMMDGPPPDVIQGPPRYWYCSTDQEPVILHGDRAGSLALGGMGAGKTTAGVQWTYLRWLEHLGQRREGGITAPTQTRLDLVLNEIRNLFPASWYRYSTAEGVLTMCDGTRIRAVSTYRQSASQGSRIQGFNWSWWLGDEMQDQIDEFVHIQARLRSAHGGKAKRLGTATSKDDSEWRALKDSMQESGLWSTHTLLGPSSPFVAAAHWDAMKRSMSLSEYRRLVLAEDLPAELAVYYGWNRERNLVVCPRIATDVTPGILSSYASYTRPGSRFALVCSHDPGVIFNTTEIMRLVMFGDVPTWMVVGELQTKQTTAREHARQLRTKLQDEFGLDLVATRFDPHPSAKAAVFIDPHGRGDTATNYDSVYMAFQQEGLDAFNPAPMSKRIPRKARVEMVNRLLAGTGSSAYEPRLVIAKDDRGAPVAPVLVASFEQLRKRPGDDNPEGTQRKDEDDKTHAPAALAYGLWPFEQEAITAETVRLARLEARRRS